MIPSIIAEGKIGVAVRAVVAVGDGHPIPAGIVAVYPSDQVELAAVCGIAARACVKWKGMNYG